MNGNKESYTTPEMEIIRFEAEDVITTSVTGNSLDTSDDLPRLGG